MKRVSTGVVGANPTTLAGNTGRMSGPMNLAPAAGGSAPLKGFKPMPGLATHTPTTPAVVPSVNKRLRFKKR